MRLNLRFVVGEVVFRILERWVTGWTIPMDKAWQLERESWEAVSSGKGEEFYARRMTSDGFIVVPGRIIDRQELIAHWNQREPLAHVELSEPRIVPVDGGNVLITYAVSAAGAEFQYRARITSLYVLEGADWALAFRQHTPDGDLPFPF